MPKARFAPGTKSPSTPSDYTDAQWNALPNLRHATPKLRYHAARQEFVNKLLLVDGTISDDIDAMLEAARLNQKPDEPCNFAEVQAMLAENRFLFVVDIDMIPRIYFQCWTGLNGEGQPNNPDLELA